MSALKRYKPRVPERVRSIQDLKVGVNVNCSEEEGSQARGEGHCVSRWKVWVFMGEILGDCGAKVGSGGEDG